MSLYIQLKKDIRQIEVGRKKLKQFGYLVGLLLILFGSIFGRYYPALWFLLMILGGVLISLAMVRTAWLVLPYRVWMTFSAVVGFFISRLLFLIVYFCVLLPVGLVRRIFNHNPLNLAWDEKEASYWIKKHYQGHDPRQPF